MKKLAVYIFIIAFIYSCQNNDGFISDTVGGVDTFANGCPEAYYPNWETSPHILPYPVGEAYTIGLSHCSGFPHLEGEPDQFAIDIIMPSGTLVTASRKGTIMFVEESGYDFEPTNNMVILRDEDGFYLQYQHLAHNGALVEQGDFVDKGDPIGYSGASGNAQYPHLHFVATGMAWQYPYQSLPITFSNTSENPKSLIQGETYEALPY